MLNKSIEHVLFTHLQLYEEPRCIHAHLMEAKIPTVFILTVYAIKKLWKSFGK